MKLLYLVFIFIFINQSFAFENVTIGEKNNFETSKEVISKKEISNLEKVIFNKNYTEDTIGTRIKRLEKEVFGMEQSGNHKERYENLVTASDYYQAGYRKGEAIENTNNNMKYYTYENSTGNIPQKENYNWQNYNYYNDNNETYSTEVQPQKKSKIKNFLTDIIEAFSTGIITGYTPPIYYDNFDNIIGTPYSNYPRYVNIPTNTYYNYNPYLPYSYRAPHYNRYNNYYMPYSPQNHIPHRYPKKYHIPTGTKNYGARSNFKIIN